MTCTLSHRRKVLPGRQGITNHNFFPDKPFRFIQGDRSFILSVHHKPCWAESGPPGEGQPTAEYQPPQPPAPERPVQADGSQERPGRIIVIHLGLKGSRRSVGPVKEGEPLSQIPRRSGEGSGVFRCEFHMAGEVVRSSGSQDRARIRVSQDCSGAAKSQTETRRRSVVGNLGVVVGQKVGAPFLFPAVSPPEQPCLFETFRVENRRGSWRRIAGGPG